MDFILYAVPFFFVLIAVELLADRWRGQRNYRVADAINSLSTGVLSTTTGLLTKGVGLLTYAFALEHLALLELPADSVWVWVFAFVFYDFCYYWLHRWATSATSCGPRIRCITRARTTTSPRPCARPAPASC
jgi:sterol desaturase/sphingolipid hydroxylase (fatty acid hydroxylase superfamily)